MDTIIYVGALRVLVSPDCDQWFAQGIEIDYAACGDSIEDVQRRFEAGLIGTINAHLEKHGNIDLMLKYAPQSVWGKLSGSGRLEILSYSKLPDILFPFVGIVYLGQKLAP